MNAPPPAWPAALKGRIKNDIGSILPIHHSRLVLYRGFPNHAVRALAVLGVLVRPGKSTVLDLYDVAPSAMGIVFSVFVLYNAMDQGDRCLLQIARERMITWILIIIISTPSPAVTSIRFYSPQACQEAAHKALTLYPGNVVAYCTQDMNINE